MSEVSQSIAHVVGGQINSGTVALYTLMALVSQGIVATGGATDIPLGISQNKADFSNQDKDVSIAKLGSSFVTASEAIAINKFLIPAASGKVQDQSDNDSTIGIKFVVGRSLSASGQDGDYLIADLIGSFLQNEQRVRTERIQSLGTTGVIGTYPNRFKAKVLRAYILAEGDVATSDSAYHIITITNKGTDGTGTDEILATSDANSTKATGGAAISDKVLRPLTLHGTEANLILERDEVLEIKTTVTGSPDDLVNASLVLDIELLFE